MKVHVINHMSVGMIVHRDGCRDIAKALRRANSDWKMDVPDGADVATVVAAGISEGFGWPESYDEGEEAPWRAEDITVMPCVKGGKS